MQTIAPRRSLPGLAVLAASAAFLLQLHAQVLAPAELGTVVNGFQDDFNGSTLSTAWKPVGAATDIYSVSDGVLHVATAPGDPNHLLYAGAPYDPVTQEVLARIRIVRFGTGDPARGGLGLGVDPATGGGINYHFRDGALESVTGRHTSFLDDSRAWGPGFAFAWQTNVWYWMRLRQETNSASQGGVKDVFAKIWPADGLTAEPAAWQSWDYFPTRTVRSGLAGITAGSSAGTSVFDVDYVLVKAAGLPAITVAPAAFPIFHPGPVTITNQPTDLTVQACASATFKVGYDGTPPHLFQWARNGKPIPDATNVTFTLPSASLADNGAVFSVTIRNTNSGTVHLATSSGAVLHVQLDPTPPALARIQNAGGLSALRLTFTKPVSIASASLPGNYSLTSGNQSLSVLSASASPDGLDVLLTTQPQTEGATYTLALKGLVDACTGTLSILPNARATFLAQVYAPTDIGVPGSPGVLTPVPGGYDLLGGGTGVVAGADQFQFSLQPRTGDFDVRVQLTQLAGPDAWTEAGIMVRESLTPVSRFAFALATPSISGALFKARPTDGAALTQSGAYPVNYPDTWLRLKRTGTTLTGFASRDGQSWSVLGSATILFSQQVYLGFAVASHDPVQTAVASFRQFSEVTRSSLETGEPSIEPLGQSSRKTGMVISEIMYHPGAHPGFPGVSPNTGLTNHLEFLELLNTQGTPEDLDGYRLAGDVQFTFPPGTRIPGGGLLVIARSPADLQRVHQLSGVLGPWSGSLPNTSGKVQLLNPTGAVFLEVNYDSQSPWPVAADGAGHSLVLTHPSFGENDPRAWSASDRVGGSPGHLESTGSEALRALVLNEFIAHSESGPGDFIELYNASTSPLDISGCVLSDRPETDGYIIPKGTTLAPSGHLAIDESQLGFALSADGGALYLRNPSQTRVLDAIHYEAQADGVAFGRTPDGSPFWRSLDTPTRGTANAPRRIGDVVINELHHHPISGSDDDQFIELYNRTDAAVDLGGWKFTAGVNFTFPDHTLIQRRGYLVVARNAAHLHERNPALNATNLVGDFTGTLAHGGERLALARPDRVIHPGVGGAPSTTNKIHVVVSEVTYHSGGRWGQWSAGGGSSLELVHPDADPAYASSWADSDETAKAPWTTFSATGTADNGSVTGDALQILLHGAGEALIDDIEVLNDASVNLIANSSFESGLTGWTAEGTMDRTTLETTEGFQSAQSLHLRAVDRGDNQVNRVRARLTASLRSNSTVTIRAKARWLRGAPSLLLRVRGNWMEAVGILKLPDSPGTPGAPNSRLEANQRPGIQEVTHSPILPADRQSVRITARIGSASAQPIVRLNYRLDPSATVRTITMLDDGSGGDEIAGDGIYTATLPGQTAGTLVAYTIDAKENPQTAAVTRFPSVDASSEALIRFGESQPSGNLPVYRIWITQANFNAWNARNKLNNTPLQCTFVLGHQRVIHTTLALYAGSPYIAPGYCGPNCGRCGYSITFPDDDPFLGSADLVLDWPGGHGNETSALQEQMAYWMAGKMGLPTCHRYPIRLHLNGVTDDQRGTVFEAVNQPASEFLKAWMPDDHSGDFFKIDRGFEFSDTGSLVADPMPTLQLFTTTGGVKKQARYRWTWNKRAGSDPNDYRNIFELVDAVNATGPEPYTRLTENLVDIEEWMGIFAVEHIVNNFDSWGHEIGKNLYAYKPQHGKWQIYLFDLDWLMLAAAGRSSTYSAKQGPLFLSNDPVVGRMYSHPPFRRAYFRAVQKAVDGPLLASNCDPVMDAKYASYVANGIRFCDGQTLTPPTTVKTWFKDRRAALQTQLDAVAANFNLTTPATLTADVSPVTLSGTAPVRVKTIQINGVDLPVTWTTVTNWTASVPLLRATNQFLLNGLDDHGRPLPGLTVSTTIRYTGSPGPTPKVFINEWMAANTSTLADRSGSSAEYDDWFELYNAGSSPVDLSGYFLTDTLTNRAQFLIPPGHAIPPGGFLLVWADNQPAQNTPGQPDLHVNFQLSAKGEAIGLFAPDGTAIDTVTFGAQETDISEGRCPDGGPTWVRFTQPTPRAANLCQVNRPRLVWSLQGGGRLRLEWDATMGARYALEATDRLDGTGWTVVSPETAAVSSSMTIDIPIEPGRTRYLRIRASP